jgi:hypothetical protein
MARLPGSRFPKILRLSGKIWNCGSAQVVALLVPLVGQEGAENALFSVATQN